MQAHWSCKFIHSFTQFIRSGSTKKHVKSKTTEHYCNWGTNMHLRCPQILLTLVIVARKVYTFNSAFKNSEWDKISIWPGILGIYCTRSVKHYCSEHTVTKYCGVQEGNTHINVTPQSTCWSTRAKNQWVAKPNIILYEGELKNSHLSKMPLVVSGYDVTSIGQVF